MKPNLAKRLARVPAFLPVPLRARADGWTPVRQARFLVALARTRCVSAAARAAGMARETTYRLRRRAGAESFAAAWDAVMGRGGGGRRKVTGAELAARALGGLVRPVVHRGEFVTLVAKPDNTALLRFLARLGRGQGRAGTIRETRGVFTGAPASTSPPARPVDPRFPPAAPTPIGRRRP